ncbi:MAG: hypothetical protein FJX36_14930 [Alphaproteobacteria bacterium]|nr:hypothetical protein [Alphaproteobacteria bacterium]
MLADLLVANVYQTLLVFARVGAAIMVLPGFGEGFVFPRARLALALLVSIVIAPVVAPSLPALPAGDGEALGLVAREVLVGLALGGIVRFLIAAIGIAGAIIATQTGLAAASMFDPSQGDQIAVVGRFLTVAVTVASSRDVGHLAILAGGAVAIAATAQASAAELARALAGVLADAATIAVDPAGLGALFTAMAMDAGLALAPVLGLLVLVAVASGLVQHGFILSTETIEP